MNAAKDKKRARQVLFAVEELMNERRSSAIPLSDIADRVGVTRSLLYVYYDGVPPMLDAIFQDHFGRLEKAILPVLERRAPFRDRAIAANLAYLGYLIEAGETLQLLLRERKQDSPLGETSQRRFRRLLRLVASDTARALALRPREAFVLLELNAAIPEALSRLVRQKEIDRDTAVATCERLIAASLDAFRLPEVN